MTTVSFRAWLRTRCGEHDLIGDLARDVLADPAWPRGPGSLRRYHAYLTECRVCPRVIEALEQAWVLYRAEISAAVRDDMPEGAGS